MTTPSEAGTGALQRLLAITDSALSTLELDDLLTELTKRTRDLLSVDTAAIMLLDSTGRDLVATAACGLEAEVRQGMRVPVGEGFAGRIAAMGEPLIIDRVDRTSVASQVLIDEHLVTMAGVPITAGGHITGVLHVGSRRPRSFTTDDIDLLRVVADRASLATQAQLSRLERATTVALQRSLVPTRLPAVDGFAVAARYIPGTAVGVGGDWYDLFTLPSGYVGVVIGDVAGNGLRAAVVMGRIRSALRAYALETDDPADVLSRLDRKIQFFEPDAMATVLYGVIPPDRASVGISVAGHLIPAVIDAGGCLLPDLAVDLPLGAYHGVRRRVTVLPVPRGTALFLYTDGLVERRGQMLSDGLGRLVSALIDSDPETICNRAISRLIGDDMAPDDIAMLAIRRL